MYWNEEVKETLSADLAERLWHQAMPKYRLPVSCSYDNHSLTVCSYRQGGSDCTQLSKAWNHITLWTSVVLNCKYSSILFHSFVLMNLLFIVIKFSSPYCPFITPQN